jgi:hypothetical protein
MKNNPILAILISILAIGSATAAFPRISLGLAARQAGRESWDNALIIRSNKLDARGGAKPPIKTMTASQMNTLKYVLFRFTGTILDRPRSSPLTYMIVFLL